MSAEITSLCTNNLPTPVRVAHSKFCDDVPLNRNDNTFNKIVSSVWSYEPATRILTYGATVFRKTSNKDFWVRKSHRERALERFYQNPVRVCLSSQWGKVSLASVAVDWFIARELIFKYGVQGGTELPIHEVVIDTYFNRQHDPFYREPLTQTELQRKFITAIVMAELQNKFKKEVAELERKLVRSMSPLFSETSVKKEKESCENKVAYGVLFGGLATCIYVSWVCLSL